MIYVISCTSDSSIGTQKQIAFQFKKVMYSPYLFSIPLP